MDHQEQKELHKKQEREREKKADKTDERVRDQQSSKGARDVGPFWYTAVGLVLALVGLLSWAFLF